MRTSISFILLVFLTACATNAQTTPPASEACANAQQLAGEMRTLRETYATQETAYQKAAAQRESARDAIFRADGALQKFFASMRGVDVKPQTAALQKVIALWKPQGSTSDLTSALKAIYGPNELLKNAAAKEAVQTAVLRANDFIAKSGDPEMGLRGYTSGLTPVPAVDAAGKKLAAGIALMPSMLDQAQKAGALAAVLQTWLQQNEAVNDARMHLEETLGQMSALQTRVNDARRECPSAKAEAPLPTLPPAALPSADADAAWQNLLQRQLELQDLAIHYDAAAGWLLPFLFDEAQNASPQFLTAILEAAVPRFEMIQHTLAGAVVPQQSFTQELEKAFPKGTK